MRLTATDIVKIIENYNFELTNQALYLAHSGKFAKQEQLYNKSEACVEIYNRIKAKEAEA